MGVGGDIGVSNESDDEGLYEGSSLMGTFSEPIPIRCTIKRALLAFILHLLRTLAFDFLFPLHGFLRGVMKASFTFFRSATFERLFMGLIVAPLSALTLTISWYIIWGSRSPIPREICIVGRRRFSRCCHRMIRIHMEDRSHRRRQHRVLFFIVVHLPFFCFAETVKHDPVRNSNLLDISHDQWQHRRDFPGLIGEQDLRCVPPWSSPMPQIDGTHRLYLQGSESCTSPELEQFFLLDELGYISAFFEQLTAPTPLARTMNESESQFCFVQTLHSTPAGFGANFERQELSSISPQTGSPDEIYPDLENHDADLSLFMQLPIFSVPPLTCEHRNDPQLVWDRIEAINFLRPITTTLQTWTQIWWHTPFGGLFQRNPYAIFWNTATCLRCVIEQRRDIPTTPQMVGPYLVRPTPYDPFIENAMQFILNTVPFVPSTLMLLIHYYDEQTTRGTLQIAHNAGWVSMMALFDSVKPTNQCRGRAWCRVRSYPTGGLNELQTWWPDPVHTRSYQHLKLDEIDPPVAPSASSNATDIPSETRTSATTSSSTCSVQACPGDQDQVQSVALFQLHAVVLFAHTTLGHTSGRQSETGLEHNLIDDFDFDESWISFEVSHGIRRPNMRERVKIHRPNPLAVARPMTVEIAFGELIVPFDVFEPIFETWPESRIGSMRWPQWKLHPMHHSYYESGLPDLAPMEYVMAISADNTMPSFDNSHFSVAMLHIDIMADGPQQNIVKCMRLPLKGTASEILARDHGNTVFFEYVSQRVWLNDDPWPLQQQREVKNGDYIYAFLRVKQWKEDVFVNINPSENSATVQTINDRSELHQEHATADQRHITLNLSPTQSTPGGSSFTTLMYRPELLLNARRAMRNHWENLGNDNTWAPIRVHATYQISPFLARYHAIFLLHQFLFVPTSSGQSLIAVEIIQIYARIARSSDFKAKPVLSPLTGFDLIILSGSHHECYVIPLVNCLISVNGRHIRPDQSIDVYHGDFAQLIIRHSDMHVAYLILADVAQAREQEIRQLSFEAARSPHEDAAPEQPPREIDVSTSVSMVFIAIIFAFTLTRRLRLLCTILIGRSICGVQAMPTDEIMWKPISLNALDDVIVVEGIEQVNDVPTPISIFDAIQDRTQCPVKERSLEIPISPEELVQFQQAWAGKCLRQHLPGPSQDFPAACIDFLINTDFLVTEDWCNIKSVQIFVDGSYSPEHQTAAWAFVAIGTRDDDREVWIGWEASVLATSSDSPQWIGAECHNAYQAELSSIFHAAWWSLSIPFDIEVSFHFDNKSAGYIAQGHWVPHTSISLPRSVRAVHQFLATLRDGDERVKPMYTHVKAHSGNIYNDLVDAVAKDAVRQKITCVDVPDIRHLVQGSIPSLERFPLVWKFYRDDPQYPSHSDSKLSWNTLSIDDFEKPDFANSTALSSDYDSKSKHLQLLLYSYNVSTLTPKDGFFSAKAEFLREQFAWRRAHVAALQETRCREQALLDTPNYFRFMSAAKDGHGGTELWFSKSTWYDEGPLWHKDAFTVIAANHELLIVSVESRAGTLVFVSAHAPHVASHQESHDSWWLQLTCHLNNLRGQVTLFLLGDFNAQIACMNEPYTGDILDPEPNINGTKLNELLERWNLWLPSTYHGVHLGPSYTWKSSKCPNGKRLDYIAIPIFKTWYTATSWCDYELDAGQIWDDHSAIAVQLSFAVTRTLSTTRRQIEIDREAIRDPANAAKIRSVLADIERPTWDIDVHCHYEKIAANLHAELAKHFPQKRRPPRRSYITETSWNLWRQKAATKKAQRELNKRSQHLLLQLVFRTWCHREQRDDSFLQENDIMTAFNMHVLSRIQLKLKQQLAADRVLHVEQLAREAEIAAPKELYQRLKSLGIGSVFRKRGPKTLPALNHPNNEPAQTVQETQEIWREFAAELEFGHATTHEKLWQQCIERQIRQQSNLAEPNFFTLPTRTQLEWACRKVSFRKATGPDGICGELFHVYPVECAELIQPLAVKMYFHTMEPIAAKGGTLVRAWKKKGDVRNPSSYRGLLISNHISKILHSVCRRTILPFYEANSLPLQIGGVRKARVTFAGQHVRAFMSWSKRASFPAAVLFLDVKTAFYRIVRPLIARSPLLYDQLTGIIERFNLPPSALQQLLQKLDQPSAVATAGVPKPVEQLIGELHESTWFQVPGTPTLTATGAGTRPGDPLADICFNFVFMNILDRLRMQLEEIGILFDLQWAGTPTAFFEREQHAVDATVMEAVWADDLALLLRSDDASELCPRLQKAASLLFDECITHGLEPNLEKGKTEAVLSIRGKHSVKTRKQIYVDQQSFVPISTCHWGEVMLRVVPTYTHLGGRVLYSGSDAQEILSRLAQTRKMYQQYRRNLFQNLQLSLEKRAQLLLPLILSILEYGMGTWTSFTSKVETKAAAQLISIYKSLLRTELPRDKVLQMSHEETLARIQLPSWEEMMHVARLRHFGGLMTDGPAPLWALLEHEACWIRRVQDSLAWMYDQLAASIPLGPPTEQWSEWSSLISQSPAKWKGWIRRAQKHAILHRLNHWSVKHWQCVIIEKLSDVGLSPAWGEQQQRQTDHEHVCGPCQLRFVNHAAWSVHAFKLHGRKHFLRQFLMTTYCKACSKEFWSTRRLHRHLRYQARCVEFYCDHVMPQPPPPGLNSKIQIRDEPYVLAPPVALPLTIEKQSQDRLIDPETVPHHPLLDAFIGVLQQRPSQQEDYHPSRTMWTLVESIRQCFLSATISIQHLRLTWDHFRTDWPQWVNEECSVEEYMVWKHILDVVQWRFCAGWLVPKSNITSMQDPSREAAFQWLESDPTPHFHFKAMPIPRAPPERFIVHLFSGRRRESDLQACLEGLECPPGVFLHVVSVDIVFGRNADLLRRESRQTWLRVFASGLVLAFFSGPPCETFSAARFHHIEGKRLRPLRSMEDQWGLKSLSLRELRQLIVANMLILFTFLCFLLQQIVGHFGMIEHPEPAREAHKPSIWRTKIWRLLSLRRTQTICVFQGLFGAYSPKPTRLAFTPEQPNLDAIFRSFQSTNILPKNVAIGIDTDGSFRTTQLKEYPPALNRALAGVFHRWHVNVQESPPTALPADLRSLLEQFEVSADACMGPDYVPPATNLIQTA